jgi:hypothetical protein
MLLALESYFGMFDGLSAAETLLAATGTAITSDSFVSLM